MELSSEHPWALGVGHGDPIRFMRLTLDWLDAEGNIVFHFSGRPDEKRIVLTSWVDGVWGEGVATSDYPFVLEPDVVFRLAFDVLSDRIEASVDGRSVAALPHRAPPDTIRQIRSSTFLWRLDEGRVAVPPEVGPGPGWSDAWVRGEDNPRRPDRLRDFRLFAVMGTWMEEDVVGATVANCLAQGCERVFVVDNASSDRTVERAEEAGAEAADVFVTERYDEEERVRRMQVVVDEVSAREEAEHVWWLWLDADEFHEGPRGLTLREYLSRLDRRFRVVGARFLNHFPDADPAYVEGRHPLEFQALYYEVAIPNCGLVHYKHPLQRWDARAPALESGLGFHTAICDETLVEPAEPIVLHHFPYRERAASERRLEALLGSERGEGAEPMTAHMRPRSRSIDAVYNRRWHEVSLFPLCLPGYAPALRSWPG